MSDIRLDLVHEETQHLVQDEVHGGFLSREGQGRDSLRKPDPTYGPFEETGYVRHWLLHPLHQALTEAYCRASWAASAPSFARAP